MEKYSEFYKRSIEHGGRHNWEGSKYFSHKNLAIAYRKGGRRQEALAQYQEILRLNPDERRAQSGLQELVRKQ